jgi:hypothetical protein
MFPLGLPGLALVLLRASVAIVLLLDEYSHRQALPGWTMVVAILLAAALFVGYLTPIVAVVALGCHGLIASSLGVDNVTVATIVSFDILALALLGPGAYSIDSYLFGRRVVLPPS